MSTFILCKDKKLHSLPLGYVFFFNGIYAAICDMITLLCFRR